MRIGLHALGIGSGARVNPKPVAGRIPVVLGGNSDAALRRAAAWGDGWYGFNLPHVEAARERVATLSRLAVEAGRDPAGLEIAVALPAAEPGDLPALEAAGVTQLVLVEGPPESPGDARVGPRARGAVDALSQVSSRLCAEGVPNLLRGLRRPRPGAIVGQVREAATTATSHTSRFRAADVTLPSYIDGNVALAVPGRGSCDVDRVIGAMAGRRHGIVTRAQLERAGVSVGAIEHRVRTGRLIVVHRGVYAVGHGALSDLARVQAALLIAPEGGASRAAALAIHGLTPSMPAVIDVTVPGRRPRNRPTVRFHQGVKEWTTIKGLKVTTPLQTLKDLGFPDRPTDEALAKRLVRPHEIARPPTRSHLEREFLHLIRAAGLPMPLVNHRLGPYLVDFYWPEHRLIVETDGATHHHDRARARDAARDAALRNAGLTVVRFEGQEVSRAPMRVVAALAGRLRA